jgi:hypothetical protein
MNAELRELVKKHFNLVEAKVETETEMAAEQSFGEIKTADGELTLVYEGEELAVELPIFVSTPDGNIPAPDGQHMLEGGIMIETEGGMIKEISKEEGEAPAEVEVEIAAENKEEMEEVIVDIPEEVAPAVEEIVSAISEAIMPVIEEMKKEIDAMKAQFTKTEQKVETFSKAPAIEKTIATIKSKNVSNFNQEFKPLNEDKAKQFERLLKIRNKK